MSFKHKVAVITGGNSGIGFTTAASFLEKGARVLITGRNPGAIQQAVYALGYPAEGFKADQSKLEEVQKLADYIKGRFGTIDTLFINAGLVETAEIATVDEAQYDRIMNTNFKGAFFTIQYILPYIKDGGSITMLSALNARAGMANTSVLSASKAALTATAKTLSRELAARRIRVNVVNPGIIDTPLLEKAGLTAEAKQVIAAQTPAGRLGESTDIANLVTFLASEEASFITGAEYNVDGGLFVHPLIA